jgi:hypothetical protein
VIEQLGRIGVTLFFFRSRGLIQQTARAAADLVSVKEVHADAHQQESTKKSSE